MSKVLKKVQTIRMKSSNDKISEKKALELYNVRILQKNLVYVVGLSPNIAKLEILESKEYFGQYGKIVRIVVNNNKAYSVGGNNLLSYSAYITYSSSREAAIAILASDNMIINEIVIKSSFGSTKYCSNFLKNLDCFNKNCLFYHYLVDEKDIMTKDENNNLGSRLDLAIKLSDIACPETKDKLNDKRYQITGNVLPLANSIYNKGYFIVSNVERKSTFPNEGILSSNNTLKSLLNKSKVVNKDENKSNNSMKRLVVDISPNDKHLCTDREDYTISKRNSISTTNGSEEYSVENRRYSDFNENYTKIQKKFLQPMEKSRFNFANENAVTEVIIPCIISEIIIKNLSTRYLVRNINILEYKKDSIISNLDHDWLQFFNNDFPRMNLSH